MIFRAGRAEAGMQRAAQPHAFPVLSARVPGSLREGGWQKCGVPFLALGKRGSDRDANAAEGLKTLRVPIKDDLTRNACGGRGSRAVLRSICVFVAGWPNVEPGRNLKALSKSLECCSIET